MTRPPEDEGGAADEAKSTAIDPATAREWMEDPAKMAEHLFEQARREHPDEKLWFTAAGVDVDQEGLDRATRRFEALNEGRETGEAPTTLLSAERCARNLGWAGPRREPAEDRSR